MQRGTRDQIFENISSVVFRLSKGMAQRIAIARGLLLPNDILLLDEVSSALDGETERELFERILTAYPKKTIIAISHNKAVWELFDERLKL